MQNRNQNQTQQHSNQNNHNNQNNQSKIRSSIIKKIVLFVIVLFGIFGIISSFGSDDYVDENIVLLALDDRPANTFVPEKTAKVSGGVNINTMPEELMEEISPKDEGFDSELIEKIGDFLKNKGYGELNEADEAFGHDGEVDAFVISADMLFFGGLVSSRNVEPNIDKEERIKKGTNILKELKEIYPDAEVYVYSSIQRLAPTFAGDVDDDLYNDIRYWAINYDRVHNEGKVEYTANLERLENRIPDGILKGYINSREMNQRINLKLLELLDDDYIDYMVISQDDAADYGLHRVEQKEIEEKKSSLNIEDKIEIFPGTDEVDGILISRYINKAYDREPLFYPIYPEVPEIIKDNIDPEYYDPEEWIPLLEDIPLEKNIEARINALGGELVDDREKADILLFVNNLNCGCGEMTEDLVKRLKRQIELDEDEKIEVRDELTESIKEFAREISYNLNMGRYAAVSDVGKLNGGCKTFVEGLLEEVELFDLLSYSGWNTAGNSLGQSLAQANNRHFYILAGSEDIEYEDRYYLDNDSKLLGARAQASLIFHRFSKDYLYAGGFRKEVIDYMGELEDNDGDQHDLGEDYDKIKDYFDDKFRGELEEFYEDYFDGRRLALGDSGDCDCCEGFCSLGLDEGDQPGYVLKSLSKLEINLPWRRLFEVDITPEFVIEREG
ncbi:DUF4127 family protein [Natranaerofaba carboxydovora]|uniref:DUF4127 family protein n=1 Tax=Natranaerofaba carboxydovora TaxID=2742683 RepID=UPI001F13ABD6|nr:DUF4127 family protein [Natranaerofaba carboxydovora]UMZ74635.1 hypothetical protein ACONDI_02234 [Natranaerofaba carboxydovora]